MYESQASTSSSPRKIVYVSQIIQKNYLIILKCSEHSIVNTTSIELNIGFSRKENRINTKIYIY